MSKIRVYELARELNLTNKMLMDKLKGLGIAVGSHMSSLEDEAVQRAKAGIFGKKEADLDEKRVKPTVIRRRRKVAETPEEPVAEALPEALPGAEAPAAPVADDVPEPAAAPAEEPLEAEAAAPASEPEPEPEPEPELEPAAAESDDAPGPAAAGEALPDSAEPAPAPGERQKKVVKKIKRDEPARIIKLPVAPVERPAERLRITPPGAERPARAPGRPGQAPPATPPPADAESKDAKRKKKKGKGEETDVEKKFIKKKISFRTKAVIEAEDLYDDQRGRKPRKGAKGKREPLVQKPQFTVAKAIKRRVKVDDSIILSDFAKRLGVKAGEIIKILMGMGTMATVNQSIDFDTAVLIAAEFNYEVERAAFEEDHILKPVVDEPEALAHRAPVVTIMGHVDHGKTSLLDVIRKTRITETEAGGITQHIGAYHVATERGAIAFLDTPGHEAFTAMRARGAKVTDIVVLVVAADDGVMPQTVEAINHARAASVPIIVAVNKIDKPGADPDRVKRALIERGLTPEEWGGDTIFVNVSAKQATGIDQLLEMILLQAEVMELRANPGKLARGHVVEAKIDSGRGPVATVLVSEGTLRNGDPVVCGVHSGKIRAMLDDRGQSVESAGPSVPVEILGLSGVPMAGDEFVAVDDEKAARQISLHRMQKLRARELAQAQTSRPSLESLFARLKEGELKDLNLILKADVHGSIEALSDALTKLSNEEVNVNVVHAATGAISESDISLATVSQAIIIGFNVRPSPKVHALAGEENVDMRFYNVIYDVINDVKAAMTGLMASRFEERVLGSAEVREVFQIPKIGAVAGCHVTDGRLERGRSLRLIRDGVVVFTGKNSSLRRFKDDVKEVQSGYECGIGIENFNDIKVGDRIEFYYLEEIKPEMA